MSEYLCDYIQVLSLKLVEKRSWLSFKSVSTRDGRHDRMSLLECVRCEMTAQWGGIKFESFGLERTVACGPQREKSCKIMWMFSKGLKMKAWGGLRLLQRRGEFPFCYCWWYRSQIRFDFMTWPSLFKKRRKSLKIALTGHFFWLLGLEAKTVAKEA